MKEEFGFIQQQWDYLTKALDDFMQYDLKDFTCMEDQLLAEIIFYEDDEK